MAFSLCVIFICKIFKEFMSDTKLVEIVINGSGQYSGEIDYIYDMNYIGGLGKAGKLGTAGLEDIKLRLKQMIDIVDEQIVLKIIKTKEFNQVEAPEIPMLKGTIEELNNL